MESILQDIRYGVRSLLKTPAFTAVALVVLALAIGANTAIFTVVNAVLLRPLPYPDADRLVMLWETNPRFQIGIDTLPVTAGDFVDWREQNNSFEQVCAFGAIHLNLNGVGEPERISAASVSPDFFRLMKVEPMLGRLFQVKDEEPGKDRVVVISYALWQKRFGGQADAIGRTLNLDGESYTVIGIAPEGFQFPRAKELPYFLGVTTQTDLWKPMTFSDDFIRRKRSDHQLSVIARLRAGATPERAQAEMTAIAQRIELSHSDSNQGVGVRVIPLTEQVVGNARLILLVLMGAVSLVLLIACANVANLLLARGSSRQREIAIRTALGASRIRIVRQLLTESVLLSLLSAIAGTALSIWGVKTLLALSGELLPRAHEINVDLRVPGFTVAIALLTSALFGLVPALRASRINLSELLKDASHGLSAGRYRNRVRSLLAISEVALSLVLLIGAGLMIKTLARLIAVDPGFQPQNTLTMNIALLGVKYPTPNQQIEFFQKLTQKVEAMPGVQSAGLISSAPLSGGIYAGGFSIEGRAAGNDNLAADRRMISPQYFNTLGIPLIEGRHFTDMDNQTSPGVVIVSESWARRFLPGEAAIGKRIKLGGPDSKRPWLSIVGIAGDVHDTALEKEARPCVYIPYSQFPSASMTLVVRSALDPRVFVGAIRDTVWSVDKDQPLTAVKTMDQYLADSISPRRFNALLLTIFASVALVLASVGVYGVMAYSVAQRVREIGIRMALGAEPSRVINLIVGGGMTLALAGVAIGVAIAWALTRVMSSLLYGVSATDSMTFVFASILLVGVTLFATYIPARRAARVDPMIALRSE
jgi:putative ABC transport system permease protein